MEFTSDLPPTNFVSYFTAEAPYVIALLYIFFRFAFTDQPFGTTAQKSTQTAKKKN